MHSRATLAKRIFFGALMTAALVGLLWGEGWLACHQYFFLDAAWRGALFALVAAVLAGLGAVELARMSAATLGRGNLAVMVLAVAAVTTEPVWGPLCGPARPTVGALVLVAVMAAAALIQARHTGPQGSYGTLGLTSLAVLYLGLGSWFLVQIRLLVGPGGGPWDQAAAVVWFLLTVKSCDIGAYLVGGKWGRRRLAPRISPGKTWEGFAGGLLLAAIVASLLGAAFGIINVAMAPVFGLWVALAGQLGDLLESMLKRDANSKDSANLVPEFGGVLDLLDSVLGAAPIAYVILAFWGRWG